MQLLKIVVATLLVGCLGVPLRVQAADASMSTLTVTGQGQIARPPDVATVAVTIVTSDDSAARAVSENNRRFAALGGKIAAVGIAPGDIISTSLQSYFNPRPHGQAPNGMMSQPPFGFVVTRTVQISVNALAQTGAVVDAATAAGATTIDGVSYSFRDRRAVERAALAAAVADAYAQAQTIAGAAHMQIVRILSIGNEAGPRPIMSAALKMARAPEPAVPTTITPSDLEVGSSVSITYVIR